ncbi:hypothetical protein PTKIN_Ptkin02bG0237500 [Pterospermum kingtungense]
MGICNSCESTSVVTAKLILQDGRLQEFPNPVKVSHILEKNPNCFICSSDDMDFDSTLCAIDEDEQLQPGELYFALPLSWLNSTITTEEMGALAIKASQALNLGGNINGNYKFCGCGFDKKMDTLLLPNKRVVRSRFMVTNGGGHSGGGGGFEVRRRTSGAGGRAGRRFTAKLTVILEEKLID